MLTVTLFEAETNLSRFVEALETGAETEIIIARDGRPSAKLVAVERPVGGQRIGVAKGRFETPDPDPDVDAAAARLFGMP